MGFRHTPDAKAPAFEARLRHEAFKSERLDACLEKFKETRKAVGDGPGNHLEMKIISGTANKALAEEISARLGVPLSPAKVRRFNDGEVNIQLCDSVRGCNVYILQPTRAARARRPSLDRALRAAAAETALGSPGTAA